MTGFPDSLSAPRICSAVVITLTLLLANAATAEPPVVKFGTRWTVECHDVTPRQYAEKNPDTKVIEVVVGVSTEVEGQEKDLDNVRFEISGDRQELEVLDYLPKTKLASDVENGAITVRAVDTGANLRLQYSVARVQGEASAAGQYHSSAVEYKKLAPKQLVLASGLSGRSSLFFKFKPSSQDTVQREQQLGFLLEVPTGWRGDYIILNCEATGWDRGVISYFDSKVNCGLSKFAVGLYLAGNEEAKVAAKDLAEQQQKYLDELVCHQKDIIEEAEQRAQRTRWLIAIVTYLLNNANSAAFADGSTLAAILPELLSGDTEKSTLPKDIGVARETLSEAKAKLRSFNGQ